MPIKLLHPGGVRPLTGDGITQRLALPAHHLVTHGVAVGMTGSGKTGLLTVMIEEALRASIPVLVFDVKGDLPNLALTLPTADPTAYLSWLDPEAPAHDGRPLDAIARALCDTRTRELAAWGLDDNSIHALRTSTALRLLTPGSTAGEPLHVLSALERRTARWDTDREAARDALSAAVSLVLRLLDRDPDPARSREHVLLSVLAERHLTAGRDATLAALLEDLEHPPVTTIGALPLDAFLPRAERRALAAALNALLASPSFASWREGTTLDLAAWLARRPDGRTPAVIVSVAHLDDAERALVLGVLLEELLAWVRSLPGASHLRALVVFDEVYGFLPPHPASPPTKRPLVALMKQARAFGVGMLLATQNPMDLDYRALSNAGLWWIGRLQTDADRARVVEGLGELSGGATRGALSSTIKRLVPRWFVQRDTHDGGAPVLVHARHALSWMRGPMTRTELRRLREMGAVGAGER